MSDELIKMENISKINSVFLGKIAIKKYEVTSFYLNVPEIREYKETLRRVRVLEKELDNIFNEKEEIYLNELGKYTTIEKRAKSTDGDIVYNITYVVSETVDEESKKQAEKDLIIEMGKYEKDKIQNEIRQEKNQKREDEIDKEYKKAVEKQNSIKDIKGIFILEIPSHRKSDYKRIYANMVNRVPKDCSVIGVDFKVNFYGTEDIKLIKEKISEDDTNN